MKASARGVRSVICR